MADAVGTRLREARSGGQDVTVKVRYGDRATITRSHTVGAPVDSPRAIGAVAGALLDAVDVSPGVRLLGVSVSGLVDTETTARQLSFDDDEARSGGGPAGPRSSAPGRRPARGRRDRAGRGAPRPASWPGTRWRRR